MIDRWLHRDLGRVAPGYLADLLLVAGDPLRDVTLLSNPVKSIRLVMKAGQIYRDDL